MVIQLVVYCPACGLKNHREVDGACVPSYIRCDCGRRVSLLVEPATFESDLPDALDDERNLAEAGTDPPELSI